MMHLSLTALHSAHHHRYWLWYTTQRCVSGVVRKVYQRLKQFKVQFFALQRKTDPSQVLLQCLPANKVCNSSKTDCVYHHLIVSQCLWCFSFEPAMM